MAAPGAYDGETSEYPSRPRSLVDRFHPMVEVPQQPSRELSASERVIFLILGRTVVSDLDWLTRRC